MSRFRRYKYLVIVALLAGGPAATVTAASGQLEVDDSTIYQQQGGGTNSAVQRVPDLFLPKRTKAAAVASQRAAAAAKAVPGRVFTSPEATPVQARRMPHQLFTKPWVATTTTSASGQAGQVPALLRIGAVVGLMVGLTAAGVALGRKFSGITREKNE